MEPVGDGSNAVLFTDRAELLACLARDWIRGVAGTRWWWRLLGSPYGSVPRLAPVLIESPQYVPAALELLAARDEAVEAVGLLTDEEAGTVLAAVRTAFGLPPPAAEPGTPGSRTDPAPADAKPTPPARAGAAAASEPPGGVSDAEEPGPPWAEPVPEARTSSLTPPQEELLGTALALRRVPHVPRTPAFAAAAARWRMAGASAGPSPRAPARAGEVAEPESRDAPSIVAERPWPVRSRDTRPAVHGEASLPEAQAHAGRQAELAETREPSLHEAEPEPPREKPDTESPRVAPAATELGGAFYLLNAAIALGLYGDFTTPAEPGIELDPFDFVALMAEELLADHRPDDGLWPLLAELAGRDPDDRPGRGFGFRPPVAWRAPADWVVPFDDHGAPTWHAAGGRLVVVHEAGFPLVDVPRRGPLRRQLDRELRPWGGVALRRRAQLRLPRDPLRRWVAWVVRYLDARLRDALAVTSRRELSQHLLEHHAEVYVTPTHVDVVLRLDELPLELRLAGLDRTPGWVPAAGRHVAFHFR